MQLWSHYFIADSISNALRALNESPGPACPIGGGTDLLLDLQQGGHPPLTTLVDINHIPELNCLEQRGELIFIGSAVPVGAIVRSTLVQEHAPALVEACQLIGGPQVRNVATLGGNVAHALPAADGMIGLLAMDAQAEIASPEGLKRVSLADLFIGPGKTALQLDREFLVGFYFRRRQPGQGSAFGRVMRPQGVALPVLNMAIWMERSGERSGASIQGVRIAVGPAGPRPLRARAIEEFLSNAPFTPQVAAQAAALIPGSLQFRSSPQRASKEYRYHLCRVLFENLIGIAWKRAEKV